MVVKAVVRPIPGARRVSLLRQRLAFPGSACYWDQHYAGGGTSGGGSYGAFAAAKADFLNDFVARHRVDSVVEFGCGDGHQLSLASYPRYVGLDVSRAAIGLCKRQFTDDPQKSFFLYEGTCFVDHAGLFQADLAISLDVIYHLVEDDVFHTYMRHLFAAADRYVVIYATDKEIPGTAPHVRHRPFSSWIAEARPDWHLVAEVPGPNTGPGGANFFVYQRRPAS